MKFLLLLCLVGLVLGTEHIKDVLLGKLHASEEKLMLAIVNAVNHGQDFHKGVYEKLMVNLYEGQEKIKALKTSATPDDTKNKIAMVNSLVKLVDDTIQNPSVRQTIKASILYLSAMKEESAYESDHSNAKDLADNITDIIKTENRGFLGTTIMMHLQERYEALGEVVKAWNVPQFDDFYKLANKTRELIRLYEEKDHDLLDEAKALRHHLEAYDNTTMAMARAWPINSQQSAAEYLALCRTHRQDEISMELAKKVEKSRKDDLFESLDQTEKKLDEAIDKCDKRSLNYFVERLELVRKMIQNSRDHIDRIPPFDSRQADRAWNDVKTVANLVGFSIKNPAVEETVKMSALYQVAMWSQQNQTENSTLIMTKVKALIAKENSLVPVGSKLGDKVQAISFNKDLTKMHDEITAMLAGNTIPTIEDDDRMIENAKNVIQKLMAKFPDLGENAEFDLDIFVTQTHKLNAMLPIDSDSKAEQWLEAAKAHYQMAKKLEQMEKACAVLHLCV